jgi:hypothetical protein
MTKVIDFSAGMDNGAVVSLRYVGNFNQTQAGILIHQLKPYMPQVHNFALS